jgi:DNA-binding CsgD family transcriptional regulator
MLPYLFMSAPVGAIYVFVLLPLASALMFFVTGALNLSLFTPEGQEPDQSAAGRGWAAFGKTEWLSVARYAGLSLLINLCCGTLNGLLASMKSEAYNKFYNLSNVSYLACSLLLGWILYRSPKMRFKTLCSVSIPLMAIGFIVFPLFESRAPFVCFFLIQAGFAFFNVYEWTYVLSIAERAGRNNVLTVLGCSMFLWWSTTWAGMALPERILSFLEGAVSEYPAILSAVAGVCLWFAWYLTPDDMASENENRDEEILADTAPKATAAKIVTTCTTPDSFGLTRREAELLPWLLRGDSPAEIAKDLFLSESTIKTHLHNIIKKIGVKNKAELIERFRDSKS